MIALVEGAERQKTPNEIALNILLAGLTIIFLLAVVTLQPFAIYSGAPQSVFVLVSLLVCLIPTTIGGLLSAIGIAGMDRLIQHNVLAMSGRAVEAAGDVHTLLLDKTGTITLGNRQATEFLPLPGVTDAGAGRRGAALVAGRRNAGRPLDRRAREGEVRPPRPRARATRTRCSFRSPRRRACPASISTAARSARARPTRSSATSPASGGVVAAGAAARSSTGSRASGGTPLVVAERTRALGVIHLKDIVKGGMRERFAAAARDGHQDGDDHRRQPADRGVDRQRSRRRRLPCRRRRRKTRWR